MINRDDIEAGDKVYTRDGGCLVARVDDSKICLGSATIWNWTDAGSYLNKANDHPLDIIRIEKAPKPVVEEIYFGWDDGDERSHYTIATFESVKNRQHVIKAVFVNGVWDKEKSEQVK